MDRNSALTGDLQRIIQEQVPGMQVSLAHIIANPDKILYTKLGLDPAVDYSKSAIGIMTVTPAETAIIMAGPLKASRPSALTDRSRRFLEALANFWSS